MPTTINGTTGIDQITDNSVATTKLQNAAVTPAKLSQPLTLGTAQNTTSGTNIDFTGIPSWVKRITVSLAGVSTSGTSYMLVQLGSGSVQTSGYKSASFHGTTLQTNYATNGFVSVGAAAQLERWGHWVFTLVSPNVWVGSLTLGFFDGSNAYTVNSGGIVTLSGTLDRIRLTTVNGTDTFDAGSANILYE